MKNLIVLGIFAFAGLLMSCGSKDKSPCPNAITSEDVDKKKTEKVSKSSTNQDDYSYEDAMKEAEKEYEDALNEAEEEYNKALEEAKSITDDEDYQKALDASKKSMDAATKAAKAAESGNIDDAMDAYKDAMDAAKSTMDAYKDLGY